MFLKCLLNKLFKVYGIGLCFTCGGMSFCLVVAWGFDFGVLGYGGV